MKSTKINKKTIQFMHNLRTINKLKRFMNKLCIFELYDIINVSPSSCYILLQQYLQYVTNIVYTNIQNIYNNTYTHKTNVLYSTLLL